MGNKVQILLIDHFPKEMRAKLDVLDASIDYQPELSRAQILARIQGVEVLVMNSRTTVDRELLDAAPKLRLLCRAGVGMDHFDLPLLAQRGIRVVNTPGANALPVGEQALGMLLGLLHHLPRANRQVKQFVWQREANRGTELSSRTVGIIGYGHTGTAFARCLSGFGCRILAYDKYKSGFGTDRVEEVGLEQLYAEVDVLSLHIPLTTETQDWVDADFLARFAGPLWLLNLARGPIVPLASLLAAFEAGRLHGAALDVLENERFSSLSEEQRMRLDRLFVDDRVIFSPHIGGWSHESLQRINDWLVKEVRQYLS